MRRAFLKRLAGFALIPFVSMVTPFLILPLLARTAGTDAWVAIAVGQSIGAFFALVVGMGFNLVGPTLVSLASPEARPELFRDATQARLLVCLPSMLLAGISAALVAPASFAGSAALMAIAMTSNGLSSAWYMIGLGRALLIVLYELLPKMAATFVAAALVVWTGEVVWYPLLLIAGSLFGIGLFTRTVGPIPKLFSFRWQPVRAVYKGNFAAVSTEVAGGAYVALAVTFVGITASASQTAAYVSGDKLYKIGQNAVGSVGNALQGWVVDDGLDSLWRRARISFITHSLLGILGLGVFVAVGPWMTSFLFGNAVGINQTSAWGFGVATLAISLNTSVGRHILVSLGRSGDVLRSVLAGGIIGIPLILWWSFAFGTAGGAWGLAVSELVVLLLEALHAFHRFRQTRTGFKSSGISSGISSSPSLTVH